MASDSENNSEKELGESGENYMDQSQDSMPDFTHLQQQRNIKRLGSKVEKSTKTIHIPQQAYQKPRFATDKNDIAKDPNIHQKNLNHQRNFNQNNKY